MFDSLEEHDEMVSIGGVNITNFPFAALAEKEQGLETLVESFDKTCTRYKMEISAEEIKLMTNISNDFLREIKVKSADAGYRYMLQAPRIRCFR